MLGSGAAGRLRKQIFKKKLGHTLVDHTPFLGQYSAFCITENKPLNFHLSFNKITPFCYNESFLINLHQKIMFCRLQASYQSIRVRADSESRLGGFLPIEAVRNWWY